MFKNKQKVNYFWNKHLLVLTLFLVFVSVLMGLIFVKYFPFLFRTPVYYCQHAWCSNVIKVSSILGTTLFKILVITILITFVKTVLDYYKILALRRSLLTLTIRNSKLKKITSELKLTKVVVVVKHQDPFAFCLGFFNSKIVISNTLLKLLDEDELKAVLCHEKYHLEHADSLTMYLARFIQSLFPFFPLLRDQIKYLSLDREIKADRQAMTVLGNNLPLITTLKKLLSYDIIPAYSTFPSFLDSNKNLEMRIRTLMQKETNYLSYSIKNILLSLSAFIIFFSLMVLPLNTVNVNAANKKEVVACMNDEACIQACLQEKQGNDLFKQLHPNK